MGLMLNLTFGGTLILLLIAGAVDLNSDKEIIKTDCYDQRNNKIDNLVCDKEVFMNKQSKEIFRLFLILGLCWFCLCPVFLIILESLLQNKNEPLEVHKR